MALWVGVLATLAARRRLARMRRPPGPGHTGAGSLAAGRPSDAPYRPAVAGLPAGRIESTERTRLPRRRPCVFRFFNAMRAAPGPGEIKKR
jgi:hypothetical protein